MKDIIQFIFVSLSGLLFISGIIMIFCLEEIGFCVMFLGFLFLLISGIIEAVFGDGFDSDYYHYVNSYYESKSEDDSEKTIIITNTRCCACGAPLEGDTCSYCNTKAVIYKKIR